MSLHDSTQVEVSLQLFVDSLSALVDPDRSPDTELASMRHGFVDGLGSKPSVARPGTVPEYYATGYRFGAEVVDLVKWSKLIDAGEEESLTPGSS